MVCSRRNQEETRLTHPLLLSWIKEGQELLFTPQPHSHMQSFPAVLQYFPRKVPCLNGSQNWFSGNLAPVISHFENPVTVEGIYWEGLWCEWKHGHYWKAWGAGAARAFFFNTFIYPASNIPLMPFLMYRMQLSDAGKWRRKTPQTLVQHIAFAVLFLPKLVWNTFIRIFIITIMEIITT